MHNLDLSLADISKIEGKATCDVTIRDGKVENVRFGIAEYKRFYTQAIRGKDIVGLPQLTARICGTCSNAHLLCAIKAVEDALSITPSAQTVALRKLLNYGLIIRDHTLHLYVFVLPDLFGRDSILDFDEKIPEEHKYLDDTFSIKAVGNNLSKIVAGRSVHAPFAAVGGFSRLPKNEDLKKMLVQLKEVRPKILDMISLFATKDNSLTRDDIDFAAYLDDEFSFLSGKVYRSNGDIIPEEKYGEYLEHRVIPYSHASGYLFDGKVYMVGALARLNLGKEKLHPKTKSDAKKYLAFFPSNNIFHNNLAQAIEVLHAIDSSIDIIDSIEIVDEKPIVPVRKAGIGTAVIEAPRGALYYKIEIDDTGKMKNGQIVVPTGQNQICIEGSIRAYLERNIDTLTDSDRAAIELQIERIVRAYDPCMSCASHFLKIKWTQVKKKPLR